MDTNLLLLLVHTTYLPTTYLRYIHVLIIYNYLLINPKTNTLLFIFYVIYNKIIHTLLGTHRTAVGIWYGSCSCSRQDHNHNSTMKTRHQRQPHASISFRRLPLATRVEAYSCAGFDYWNHSISLCDGALSFYYCSRGC